METIRYKKLANDVSVSFDVHFPINNSDGTPLDLVEPSSTPTVIYFHGGGLTVGNRQSWFPAWLQRRVLSLGFLFISSDYQLIPPATGHDIVQDIQELLAFLVDARLGNGDGKSFRVDPEAIAVSGSSAGGLCAYLAAMHCISPKPKAMVSVYGMGGNFFTSHYLQPKSQVFFRGREMLNSSDFDQYLYPFKGEALQPTSDAALSYHPPTYHIPGYPANPRMLLARLYLQLGQFLDYYTGQHSPSLSAILRELLDKGSMNLSDFKDLIPESHRRLFPQIADKTSWPPTLLLHGTADSAVPIEESRNLRTLLESAGVSVDSIEFEGMEHSFDYEQDAEVIWGEMFDAVKAFLGRELTRGDTSCQQAYGL